MSYQVIARKWRPQSFTELVGQDPIAQTLLNALRSNRFPHALLFTGPRGTGKTSSARILAKSLRCPQAPQNNWVPCQVCDTCLEIAQSRHVDVIEIDGASNNGVDAIRELRETVSYLPSFGRYKVYIIDEVHMLSLSAFNALLKTLEEPPPHVVFIMATTEVHKIPQTILSRCQRFDFRRITTRQIQDHLQKICNEDGIKAEPEAIWLIARQGDGSMRDSQSLLEQVITFSQKELTHKTVMEILGLTDRQIIYDTLDAVLSRNPSALLQILERYHQTALEPHLLAQDLMESIRHLTVVKVAGSKTTRILDLPDSEVQWLLSKTEQHSQEELHFLFDITLKGVEDIMKASDPRLVLEMVLLRLSAAPKISSLHDLLNGIPSQLSHSEASPAAISSQTNTAQTSVTKTEALKSSSAKMAAPKVSVSMPAAASMPTAASAPTTGAASTVPTTRGTTTTDNTTAVAINAVPTSATPSTAMTASQTSQTSQVPQTPAATSVQTTNTEMPIPPTSGPKKLAPLQRIPETLSPEAKWMQTVEIVKQHDILVGSKLDGVIFVGLKEKTLQLGIPQKMQFIRQQMQDPNFSKKLKSFIDQLWGTEYVFEALVVKEKGQGMSAIEAVEHKKQQEGDALRQSILEHPVIKTAQEVFNAEVVQIKDLDPKTNSKPQQ